MAKNELIRQQRAEVERMWNELPYFIDRYGIPRQAEAIVQKTYDNYKGHLVREISDREHLQRREGARPKFGVEVYIYSPVLPEVPLQTPDASSSSNVDDASSYDAEEQILTPISSGTGSGENLNPRSKVTIRVVSPDDFLHMPCFSLEAYFRGQLS